MRPQRVPHGQLSVQAEIKALMLERADASSRMRTLVERLDEMGFESV